MQEFSIHCVVLADDQVLDSTKQKVELLQNDLPDTQRKSLNGLLCKHASIFSDCPGKTDSATHMIVTEDKGPIVSHPYRLCPAWKDQVRLEIETLFSGGIIRESTSPWASPIVPV